MENEDAGHAWTILLAAATHVANQASEHKDYAFPYSLAKAITNLEHAVLRVERAIKGVRAV